MATRAAGSLQVPDCMDQADGYTHSMNTRELILDAAARVFAEVGSRGATTRRIAEEARVNEVTLFRHFGSKEALLGEALEWMSQRVEVATLPAEPQDPLAELTPWCTDHLYALHHARSLLRTSMGEFEANPAASALSCRVPTRVAAELKGYLERLRERGMCAAELDLPAASALLMGALFSDAISRDIMPERFPYSLDEAAERYVRLFLRTIAPGPDVEREPGRGGEP
jgi:AcrR family transcriptional regulator